MPLRPMVVVLAIVIYCSGRALGWLVLSLALGRAVLMKEDVVPKLASVGWGLMSLAIAAFLCSLYPGWTFSLPF